MSMAPVNVPIAYKMCDVFGVADDKVVMGGTLRWTAPPSQTWIYCVSKIPRKASQSICSFYSKEVHFFICGRGFPDSVDNLNNDVHDG